MSRVIKLSDETYKKLRELKTSNDSFDEIIGILMKNPSGILVYQEKMNRIFDMLKELNSKIPVYQSESEEVTKEE